MEDAMPRNIHIGGDPPKVLEKIEVDPKQAFIGDKYWFP